jgi:hypothetical protein
LRSHRAILGNDQTAGAASRQPGEAGVPERLPLRVALETKAAALTSDHVAEGAFGSDRMRRHNHGQQRPAH